MKKIIINSHQEYFAEKAIKKESEVVLYNVHVDDNVIEKMTFPNISNMNEFKLEEGQEWDVDPEMEKEQRIVDLEIAIASILGGAL